MWSAHQVSGNVSADGAASLVSLNNLTTQADVAAKRGNVSIWTLGDYLGGVQAVIRSPSSTGFWAGFPSVSYNVSLDAYLAVFVSADGFYYSVSSDLTNWTVGKKLLTRNETPNTGEPWLLYPSLLSPSQPTDSTTGATGYLYYGHGIYNVECHHMVRRPVQVGWSTAAAN